MNRGDGQGGTIQNWSFEFDFQYAVLILLEGRDRMYESVAEKPHLSLTLRIQ